MANENIHAPPSRTSDIYQRKITEDTWRVVTNLKTSPEQAGNLASNPMSMMEGHYCEDAWMRAVYADETIVDFLLMVLWPPTDGYYMWRLMIDQEYQEQGFGKQVVKLAIQHVNPTYPKAERLGVMFTQEEGAAVKKVLAGDSHYHFYTKLGFKQTAEPDEDGEVMMEIKL
ncbi:hypothetical protein E4T43_07234 [Aureobasidium subglaciale]|nr:hypothetical protein E4T43_07234 [Aureobasidium subglaciale]